MGVLNGVLISFVSLFIICDKRCGLVGNERVCLLQGIHVFADGILKSSTVSR